jgi:ketosteroid isomerase-like protein
VSQENVELVKRLIDAFNRREVDGFAELTTPDFEWITSMSAVEGEVFRGREGIETYFGRMKEAWDEFLAFADDYRDLGDRVLFEGLLQGRGLGSGVPVTTRLDILYDVRDGRISKMHSFLDHHEALRAAGLEE